MEEAGGERGTAPGRGGGPGSLRHAGEVGPPHVSSKDSQVASEEEAGPRSRTGGAGGAGEAYRFFLKNDHIFLTETGFF